MFNLGINDWFVSKYSDGTRIKLVEENPVSGETGFKKLFKSKDTYNDWIDNVVDDETASYNQAQALTLLFEALAHENGVYD
ncbi:MAG: hypothetical protein V3U87_11335 [Methylococcaceae bacterium]